MLSMQFNAQTIQTGYYRVKNQKTERFVYVYDNTGKINVQTTSADMGGIELWKKHERTISDPASIIHISNLNSDNRYDLSSQGTSVYKIIGHHVQLYPSNGAWKLYATVSGMTKYLSDDEASSVPDGQMGTISKGEYRNWIVIPVDTEENYFGIKPTLSAAEKHYKPFYADFAFSFAGTGMKAYYISETYKHIAVIKEIKDEIIAANTPVIIECSAEDAASNKLNLFRNQGAKPTGNLMKGVYFNNPKRPKSPDARTEYDASTMRVLGVLADGTLGFVTSTEEYLAANESYLVVPKDTPAEMVVMTEEELAEYKENETGISQLKENKFVNGVYSLTGVKVADKMVESLPKGVYIINGKKIVKP